MKSDSYQQFRDADIAYERGDHELAFKIFLALALEGNIEAMTRVAVMYASGIGAAKNISESIAWDRKAIGRGSRSSALNLGLTYRSQGNLEEAVGIFEAARRKGDGEASLELAMIHVEMNAEQETVATYLREAICSEDISEESKQIAAKLISELRSSSG